MFGTPVAVVLAEGPSNTPFGVTTRGSNVYVTFAGSDTVGVVKNDRQTAFAATGIPGGAGQHSPCWIAVVGPPGAIALAVYQWFGVAFLRKGWINLDLIWTVALVATGLILLLL